MASNRREEFRNLLENLGESLDISEAQYEAATKHYEAVGKWLNAKDSPIVAYLPAIYPQGSFRLGTVTKPVNEADHHDVDLTCELKALREENVTQSQLKTFVGQRLLAHDTYKRMLEERNRCWRLEHADSVRFHMDILPAISDRRRPEGPGRIAGAILIPDKELHDWQSSNPIGYAEWFKLRMKVRREAGLVRLAEALRIKVQDIPDYKVKTPLQRAIQILKRHRDVMFAEDQDNRPISIIISTLAAHAYNNEADILEALENIVAGMPRYIEARNGVSWVTNPVNSQENFADKWQSHPQRGVAFTRWLRQIQVDLESAIKKTDVEDMVTGLKPRFGEKIITEAASRVFPMKSGTGRIVAPAAREVQISNPSKPWRI